jgi:hypothetical protein
MVVKKSGHGYFVLKKSILTQIWPQKKLEKHLMDLEKPIYDLK